MESAVLVNESDHAPEEQEIPEPGRFADVSPPKAVAHVGEPAVICTDVWKQYYFYAHRPRKLKEAIFQTLRGQFGPPPGAAPPVWAIREFNLKVWPGETVGLVGHNGAGKSTLLKLLSRILVPTRGTIKINGASGRTG